MLKVMVNITGSLINKVGKISNNYYFRVQSEEREYVCILPEHKSEAVNNLKMVEDNQKTSMF